MTKPFRSSLRKGLYVYYLVLLLLHVQQRYVFDCCTCSNRDKLDAVKRYPKQIFILTQFSGGTNTLTARTSIRHILHHQQTTLRGARPLRPKYQRRALNKRKQVKDHWTNDILDGFSSDQLCSPARSLYMCWSLSSAKPSSYQWW